MIIVSDTTPINYLILIDQIHLLRDLYGQVVLPQAVFDEMQSASAPDKVRAWISNRPEWLELRTVSMPDSTLNLGAGEKEAITLAREMRADLLLMDDKKGRRAAQERGLTVIGTLAVLATAARRELVNLPAAIEHLKQTNFRAPSDLMKSLVDEEFTSDRK